MPVSNALQSDFAHPTVLSPDEAFSQANTLGHADQREVNMTNANSAAAAAGRLLMSIIFLLSGFQKLGGFNGTVAYMACRNRRGMRRRIALAGRLSNPCGRFGARRLVRRHGFRRP